MMQMDLVENFVSSGGGRQKKKEKKNKKNEIVFWSWLNLQGYEISSCTSSTRIHFTVEL